MRYNKTYKGKLTKRNKELRVKKTISFLLLMSIIFGGYWSWVSYWPEYSQAVVEIERDGDREDLTTRQRAIKYLESREVSENFISRFECLMYFENRGYDEYSIHINNNGSYDRGLLQWNNKTAPIKIDNQCALNLECGLNEFVNYINKGGSWNRWFGYKYNCI